MSALIYQCFKLSLATLYPAYSSYKAVKTKNVKEYVKWMMYWVVYAFFVAVELVADFFVAWLPFYYELKIIFVLWLLSPTTKGSSILYRKLIHPQLSRRESEIDCYIERASEQSYSTLLALGSRAVTLTTNVILANAIKGQTKLVDHLSKSGYGSMPALQGIHDDSGVDKQDGGGEQEQTGNIDIKLQRSESTMSVASADERDNAILRDCFQEVMSDKRPVKSAPLASKELRNSSNLSHIKRKH